MKPNKTSPPILVTQPFDLSTDALWALVSAPGNLNDAHPFCDTNTALNWNENGHVDRLVYLNGRTYIRKFQTWNEGEGYTLLIGEENGPQSFVEWTINSLEGDRSSLTITVHPFILANWPRILSFLPYEFWVRARLKTYLRSVLSGFLHVAQTGKAVPRNQFGRHPWFS